MGEIESAAKGAKDRLVAALSLLQLPLGEPGGADIALPMSRAIGALHRLETSGSGRAQAAVLARDDIRRTLAALQEVGTAGRVPEEALELVAGCLGVTHQLSEILSNAVPREGRPQRPRSTPEAPPFEQVPVDRRSPDVPPVHSQSWPDEPSREPRHPTTRSRQQPDVRDEPPRKGAHVSAPGGVTMAKSSEPAERPRWSAQVPSGQHGGQGPPTEIQPDQGLGSTRMSRQEASVRIPDSLETTRVSLTHDQASPRGAGAPLGEANERAFRSSPEARKRHGQTMESPALGEPTSRHARGPNTIPKADAMVFEANLGAHSATNFYKGLSGNDVVDHGGIFVASYQIPTIGTPLWLKVTMPGGYDFEASARVVWTRDSASPDAPPGFGARFDKLSDEARQLIYRYARNREPLFHDDL